MSLMPVVSVGIHRAIVGHNDFALPPDIGFWHVQQQNRSGTAASPAMEHAAKARGCSIGHSEVGALQLLLMSRSVHSRRSCSKMDH